MMTTQRRLMIFGGEQMLLFSLFANRRFLILTSTTSEPFRPLPTITTDSWGCLSRILSITTFSLSMIREIYPTMYNWSISFQESVFYFFLMPGFSDERCRKNLNIVYAVLQSFHRLHLVRFVGPVRWTVLFLQPRNIWQSAAAVETVDRSTFK